MNEIVSFPFSKPALLDRDQLALDQAAKLRAQGCLTGVICCVHCFVLSNWFVDGAWHALQPKDWAMFRCPACGKLGTIFLHDDECLQANQNKKEIP